MRPGLAIGEAHVVCYTVPMHQTVPGLLPALAEFRRGQPVFATGFMVGLMEAPCMAAVDPYLEPGEATVGTLINMDHLLASPPGSSLVAEARAIAIDGRSVRFAVLVEDAAGDLVAAGEHGLRVIDVARFRDRLAAKQARLHPAGSARRACERQRLVVQASDPVSIGDARIAVGQALHSKLIAQHGEHSLSRTSQSRQRTARATLVRAGQPQAPHDEDDRLAQISSRATGAQAIERGRSTPLAHLPGSTPWCRRVVLADGGATLVRRVQPDDGEGLLRFLEGLSSRSVYLRFCSGGVNLKAAVGRFIEIDDDRFGLLACDPDGDIVAHAEYLVLPGGQAEVAVVVADRLHGQGLARGMIDLLVAHAQARGIERLVASVLPANDPMLAVFTHAFGATVRESAMDCQVSFSPRGEALAA